GLPPMRLGVLRLLEEPFGDVVLDEDLREPAEDARLPGAPPGLGRFRLGVLPDQGVGQLPLEPRDLEAAPLHAGPARAAGPQARALGDEPRDLVEERVRIARSRDA